MTRSPTVDRVLRRRTRRNRVWNNETYAAVALVAATLVALVWANVGGGYEQFWQSRAGFTIGPFAFDMSLHDWVDEGLMALFFFMVGLDVRRELAIGDLRLPGRALLPVSAAVGGLIAPAVVFLAIAGRSQAGDAWGVVISTDTAFALGMLALIGPRNAPRLRLFLLALAVIDDIGALTVIGIFYTTDLNAVGLLAAAACLAGIWILQRRGAWRVWPYLILGVLTWYAVYVSGVHATLAGVLIALLMPVHSLRRKDLDRTNEIYHLYRQAPTPNAALLARDALAYSIPLNQRLSAVLPGYVNYLVVPLFALANAGIPISGDNLQTAATSPLTWGIIGGLVVGKLVGITAVSAIILRLVPSSRLPGLDLPRVAGVGAISGMGFTISLLVVGLAIEDEALQNEARMGVLGASALALILATIIFRLGDRLAPVEKPHTEILRRPVDPTHDHIFGAKHAPVSVVVYTAMSHEYRTRTEESLREAYEQINQQHAHFVYRHHVTDGSGMLPALALEAAARQGRFWEMHDALLRVDGPLNHTAIDSAASTIGLDTEVFAARVSSGDDTARIDDDNLDVAELEQDDTTLIYVDGKRLLGPLNSWWIVENVDKITP